MPEPNGFVQNLPAVEGKNASRVPNPVPFNDHPSIVNGIVWEKNRFQHFGGGDAIDGNAGLDRFLELDGLLDGNQGANAHIGQTLDRLDYNFDVLQLFMGSLVER